MSPIDAILRKIRDTVTAETRIVYPSELPSLMRKHIYTGMMGSVYFTLFTGILFVTFGEDMGLRDWQWGLLAGCSSFVLVLQLVSALLVTRLGTRKELWFFTAIASRICKAAAVTACFWLVTSGSGPQGRALLIVLLVLANAFESIAGPPWMSWLADLIPREQHGRFWGRRTALVAVANIAVMVPMTLVIDYLPESWRAQALLAVFAFAFVVGALDLFIHRTIPEPAMAMPPRSQFLHEIAAPFRDPRFRPWLAFNCTWTFGMTLGGSLAMLHFVRNLGLDRNLTGGAIVLNVLPLIATAFVGSRVGRLVDRRGVRRMLVVGHLGWGLLPLFWILATPSTALYMLGAGAFLGGMASTTAITAANKLITRLPPDGHVAMYVAVSGCLGNLAGGLGPLVGGLLLHAVGDWSLPFGPLTIVGFHILFVSSLALRLGATALLRRVSEPPDEDAPPPRPAP